VRVDRTVLTTAQFTVRGFQTVDEFCLVVCHRGNEEALELTAHMRTLHAYRVLYISICAGTGTVTVQCVCRVVLFRCSAVVTCAKAKSATTSR
jgi:hypothetical protein